MLVTNCIVFLSDFWIFKISHIDGVVSGWDRSFEISFNINRIYLINSLDQSTHLISVFLNSYHVCIILIDHVKDLSRFMIRGKQIIRTNIIWHSNAKTIQKSALARERRIHALKLFVKATLLRHFNINPLYSITNH